MDSLQDQFLLEKRYNEGLAPATLSKYRFFFALLEGTSLDPESPGSFVSRNVRNSLATLGHSRGWSPVTYNTARKIYRTYAAWLHREKMIPENPFDSVCKMSEPQTPRKSITTDQAKYLRYVLPKLFDPSSFVGLRNYSIILTFLYTGLRRNELLSLVPSDFDPLNRSILVRKAKMGKFRFVPVPDQLYPVLVDYASAHSLRFDHKTPFFPTRNWNPLSERDIRAIFARIREKLGFAVSPHRLRHTFATELVRHDFDIFNVAAVLGHSSVRTTQIYLTADPDRIGKKISSVPLYQ